MGKPRTMFLPPTRNSWMIAPRGRKVNSACSGGDILFGLAVMDGIEW